MPKKTPEDYASPRDKLARLDKNFGGEEHQRSNVTWRGISAGRPIARGDDGKSVPVVEGELPGIQKLASACFEGISSTNWRTCSGYSSVAAQLEKESKEGDAG